MDKIVALNGYWKYKLDPKDLGEKYREDLVLAYSRECRYMDLDHDDRDWDKIEVPACWQTQGYNYNGIAWYRRSFNIKSKEDEKVYRLKFKGVDYFADTWVNGFYLGSHEGFFNKFEYDITELIKEGENILAIKVDSPNDINVIDLEGHEKKTLIKGALQDWDVNNLSVNPGGIYDDVLLEASNYIYLKDIKIDCLLSKKADNARVRLRFAVVNHFLEYKNSEMKIIIKPKNFDGEGIQIVSDVVLGPGESEKEICLNIKDPKLWWTWDLGKPHIYTTEVELRCDKKLYDNISMTFGIRNIERKERS